MTQEKSAADRPMMSMYAGLPVGLTSSMSNLVGNDDASVLSPGSAAGVLGGATGGVMADVDKNPVMDRLRGILKGVGTGAGAYFGGKAMMPQDGDPNWGTVGGVLGGGALGYLGSDQLLKLVGMRSSGRKSVLDRDEEKYAEASSPLISLLTAKMHSDQNQYLRKHAILRDLIRQSPSSFVIDSDNGHTVGLTHTPTNFRIHMPKHMLPMDLVREDIPSTVDKVAEHLITLLGK